MVKLVIWDWNGTLLDDTRLCFEIANVMRQERGMEALPDLDAYCRVFCFPVVDYYRKMGYTFETETYEDVSVEFVDMYARRVAECPLQPHAHEVLSEIRRRGIPQVLLSATGADRLYDQTALYDLPKYFERIVGNENNLAHGKAAQAAALIQDCGLSPDEVLFVGDTDHDYAVSAAVGCQCVLLTRGHHLREHLLPLGVPLIGSLPELLPYLE